MPQTEQLLQQRSDTDLAEPPRYRVVLYNDDFTTMDFVVMVLMVVFNHKLAAAEQIMMAVHRQGRGICGVYSFEVAETKVAQVRMLAEEHQYPLRCEMEKE
ncbi:ATP-dependent Clp protease adapter ClpS [Victivallis sp. Marseille-Q1083]|uniref:ATP-dependent Clp protease adapter ClpS n=1 Tax=Victivallis sp. Marseille-Q1083 TaxID=2717288 RepID=UPI001588B963|nr:ATP-dependent Clp protease adapter ClpS [Victivallis sp. Marseille-Q1083]